MTLDDIQQKTLKFDKVKFEDRVRKELGYPESAGFAAVIIKNGQVAGEAAGGWAIVKSEKVGSFGSVTKTEMTTSTPTNIGSCFKIISFITLLSQAEKKARELPPKIVEVKGGKDKEIYSFSTAFDYWLHRSVYHYLPTRWRQFIVSNSKKDVRRQLDVSFMDLLRHKSGYPDNPAPRGMTVSVDVKQADRGYRDYQNINATILTYLFPHFVGAGAGAIEKQVEDNDIANDDYDAYIELYGKFFETWMQQNVFDKITPKIWPSCDPWVDYYQNRKPKVPFALSYDTPDGGNPRFTSTKGGHAQGGWYLSMQEFAAFMANAQATNVLISPEVWNRMYDDTSPQSRDDRLGWSSTLTSTFASKYFDVNAIPWHGGYDPNYSTAVVRLPGGYIAVGSVNGAPGDKSGSVAAALKNGWVEALQDNFE